VLGHQFAHWLAGLLGEDHFKSKTWAEQARGRSKNTFLKYFFLKIFGLLLIFRLG
jgi:hypothetical protein